jgi:hypothetical protein
VKLDDRRNALMWALGWWLVRRWMKRRAALAVAGIATGAASRRRSIGAVLGAVLLVGALAAAFVAWRRLAGRAADDQPPLEPYTPPGSVPQPVGEAEATA